MGARPVTNDRNYWSNLRRRRVSRRSMLAASARAGVGAAGLALLGCGDDDDTVVAAVVIDAEEEAEQAAAGDEELTDEAAEDQVIATKIGGPERGGKLTLTWAQSISGGFNPYIAISGSDHLGYLGYLYDSVLGFDTAGRIAPDPGAEGADADPLRRDSAR